MDPNVEQAENPKPNRRQQPGAAKHRDAQYQEQPVNAPVRKVCTPALAFTSHHARRLEREISKEMRHQDSQDDSDKGLHIFVQYFDLCTFSCIAEVSLNHLLHGFPGLLDLPPETAPQVP